MGTHYICGSETIRLKDMDAPETRGAKCEAELMLGGGCQELMAREKLGIEKANEIAARYSCKRLSMSQAVPCHKG